ncbi:type II toxin-antitoxin system RelE/ParE family toxin [Botrimarina sp.]|uniref:type II toxin-antitoxin system RelE/ParE family toxin n=1 Tax=Botrimarina sp. TaxID=2795802 RepID=UPI0032EFFF55
MAKVIWSTRSRDHLRRIDSYLATHSFDAAARVVEGIFETTQTLAAHPRLGWREPALPDREVRNLLYGRYRIVYQIRSEDAVEVLAVVHTSRDFRPKDLFDGEEFAD